MAKNTFHKSNEKSVFRDDLNFGSHRNPSAKIEFSCNRYLRVGKMFIEVVHKSKNREIFIGSVIGGAEIRSQKLKSGVFSGLNCAESGQWSSPMIGEQLGAARKKAPIRKASTIYWLARLFILVRNHQSDIC